MPERVRTRPIYPYAQTVHGGYVAEHRPTCGQTMTDNLTPGYFKTLRAAGNKNLLPVNRLSSEKSNVQFISGTHTWDLMFNGSHHGNFSTTVSGCLAAASDYQRIEKTLPNLVRPVDPKFDNATKALLQKAVASAKTNRWDLGTFLAESRSTVSLIDNFGKNVLTRARKIASTRPHWTAEAFSDQWLEYRYGWRTLMYDVEDIRESISIAQEKSLARERQTEFVGEVISSSSRSMTGSRFRGANDRLWFDATIGGNWNCLYQLDETTQQRRESRCGAMVEHMINEAFFVDPLVTAYELIPFSFIADWFFNFNDAIAAWSPYANSQLLHSWATVKEISEIRTSVPHGLPRTFFVSGWSGHPNGNYTAAPRSGSSSVTITKERLLRDSLPLEFNVSYDLNLDLAKVLDITSIAYRRARAVTSFLPLLTRR